MNLTNKIIALASSVLFISCGDPSGGLVNLLPVNPPTAVTKILSKVTTTVPATAQVNTEVYNYTSSKLTSVFDSDNSVNYALDYTNAQISKITITRMTMPSMLSNLTYTGSQLTGISGVIYPDVTFESTLTYTAGKLTLIDTDYYMMGVPGIERTKRMTLEYSGENVNRAIVQDEYFNIPSTTTKNILFTNFDLNPNPYRTIPTDFTIVKAVYSEQDDIIAGLSVNNYQNIEVQAGGSSAAHDVTLTYGAHTYPTDAVTPVNVKAFEYIP